jgi:hypothetical protein
MDSRVLQAKREIRASTDFLESRDLEGKTVRRDFQD